MKRTGLFFSCFLLLGIALVAGAANNAFAARGTPPVPQTAILVCQVSGTGIIVSDYSNTSSVVVSASEDCAAALAALEGAGLGIRNVQSLNSFPISIIYTFVGRGWETPVSNPSSPGTD